MIQFEEDYFIVYREDLVKEFIETIRKDQVTSISLEVHTSYNVGVALLNQRKHLLYYKGNLDEHDAEAFYNKLQYYFFGHGDDMPGEPLPMVNTNFYSNGTCMICEKLHDRDFDCTLPTPPPTRKRESRFFG